ncbi:hypothetical protein Q3G72_000423 [Acer saccharum]|nr:hypothetical protein Q3G72_000423 [Acer saccharum]
MLLEKRIDGSKAEGGEILLRPNRRFRRRISPPSALEVQISWSFDLAFVEKDEEEEEKKKTKKMEMKMKKGGDEEKNQRRTLKSGDYVVSKNSIKVSRLGHSMGLNAQCH